MRIDRKLFPSTVKASLQETDQTRLHKKAVAVHPNLIHYRVLYEISSVIKVHHSTQIQEFEIHCPRISNCRSGNQCQIGSLGSDIPEQHQIRSRNRDPFDASTVKNQQPAQFYRRFLQNYILNHNHGGQAENYHDSINVPTDLHPVCELLHLRPNLLQEI